MELKEKYKKEFLDIYGDRIFVYLKFTKSEEWAKDIINGRLYMNPIGFYRDLELKDGMKGQGDSQELRLVSENIQIKLITHNPEKEIPLDSKRVKFQYTNDQHTPIFCILGIRVRDLVVCDYDEQSIKVRFPFNASDVEHLKRDFGEFVVMVSPEGFECAVHNTLTSQNLNGFFKEVIYCDPDSLERQEDFLKGSIRRYLYKNIDFAYQKEFRLVLDEKITSGKFFDVGSLSDFSHILKVEDFLDCCITMTYNLEDEDE